MKYFFRRLGFAWQAFKNADRAMYGVIVGIGFDGYMPSEVERSIHLTVVGYDGTKKDMGLKFFGTARAVPRA